MRFFLALVCFSLLLTSSKPPEDWGDRLKDWLPDFITEWWWPAPDEGERYVALSNAPSAGNWLDLPLIAQRNQQFDWPLPSLTPARDEARYAKVATGLQVLQDPYQSLPLAPATPLRLIYHSTEYPIYFGNIVESYAPTVMIDYQRERDREMLGLARPEVINLLYVRAAELESVIHPWFFDFAELPAIVVYEGDPDLLENIPEQWVVITLPEAGKEADIVAALSLFGVDPLLNIKRPGMLGYATPEAMHLDRAELEKVDYHINRAIRKRAMPGAQLVVTKGGQIVYQKSYGYHTYQKKQPVYTSDQYDLASVTKSAATSLAVMLLYDAGKISLDGKAKDYLPELDKSVAGRYTVEQLLTHQTGLQANLPVQAFVGRQHVSNQVSDDFPIQLSADRWLDKNVPAQVTEGLKKLDYTKRRMYRYSDVNYVLLQQIVERVSGQGLAELLAEKIYQPLGLLRLGYQPHLQFQAEQTVPTSRDYWMRNGLVRGFVHDEGAALMGGVAGHAGLFATATDLARLYQMLLDDGKANGQQIISAATVELFTSRSRQNYRALGFDRLAGGWPAIIQAGASEATFGHTGFSGTCVWADPENDLVFVLLTNRIHPDPKNNRFKKYGVRGKVHRQVYRSILKSQP